MRTEAPELRGRLLATHMSQGRASSLTDRRRVTEMSTFARRRTLRKAQLRT
jgi:hypothetical protein